MRSMVRQASFRSGLDVGLMVALTLEAGYACEVPRIAGPACMTLMYACVLSLFEVAIRGLARHDRIWPSPCK